MENPYLNRNQVDNTGEKLIIGKSYYTFYFERRGKKIAKYTGIFSVKLERIDSLGYGRWETTGGKLGSLPSVQNLLNQIYHNDCWPCRCDFFVDEESATKAHNEAIKSIAPEEYHSKLIINVK